LIHGKRFLLENSKSRVVDSKEEDEDTSQEAAILEAAYKQIEQVFEEVGTLFSQQKAKNVKYSSKMSKSKRALFSHLK
jgi:hypothetical protein